MKLIIPILLAILTCGCAPHYQVVQKLDVNMYHLYNTRKHEVVIILSQDNLKEGELIKLKNIHIIAEIPDEK